MPSKVFRDRQETTGKIIAIFSFILLFFLFFYTGTIKEIFDSDNKIKLHKIENLSAFRGSIRTIDGSTLASSIDTWYFAINGKNFDEDKYETIAKLLSIYTNRSEKEIIQVLKRKKRVVLEDSLSAQEAKRLKKLAKSLNRLGVLRTFNVNGAKTKYSFEIVKNSMQKREYIYKDLLTPIIGFVRKTDGQAVTGIEKYYDDSIRDKEKGWIYAQKDIGGNIIYNNKMEYSESNDGSTIILNINSRLQKRVENILSAQKEAFGAQEVITGIMDSKSGDILALATSNRYNPEKILDVANTKMNHLQYYFEPGSVIKPLFLAKAMDLGRVKRFDLFEGHNGRWKLERKTIVDDVRPIDWMSAEDILIHSSNIGISKVVLKLNGYEMREAFDDFGISKYSEIDLPFEREGVFPTADMYDGSDIYKATSSYGYGFQTNFIRILKAYNVFNNNGKLVKPKLANTMRTGMGDVLKSPTQEEQVLSRTTANVILSILRKTATKGTARKANIDGLFIAGKTGTAHIARKGQYVNSYNSSFFGFVNDKKRKLTLGVTFIEPTIKHFSSQTAAPTAKMIIEAMLDLGILEKEEEIKEKSKE